MKKAEWLLIHYHDFQSRKNILLRKYSRLKDTDSIQIQEAEEIIAGSVKGSIITNDIPHDHSGTSRTEAVALSYKEKIQKALQEQSLELIQEIQQLDFCIHLCEDLLSKQSEKDQWLLTARYIEKKTFEVMVSSQPPDLGIYTRQTMSKHCKELIDKLEKYLQGVNFSTDGL